MSLVLDSSVTIAWLVKDEDSDAVASIILRVINEGAVVPSLWRLEVANVLRAGVRRKRLTLADRDESIADLLRWPIEIDGETDRHAWAATLRLSDRHGLTLYDAAYLELAGRRDLPLATLDADLIRAAAAIGVTVCG